MFADGRLRKPTLKEAFEAEAKLLIDVGDPRGYELKKVIAIMSIASWERIKESMR